MAALAPTLPVPRLARKRDDELVARVRAGDDGAFNELYERHRPALVRYAKRILGDRPPGPEDVVQEVFVKAHGALRAGGRARGRGRLAAPPAPAPAPARARARAGPAPPPPAGAPPPSWDELR